MSSKLEVKLRIKLSLDILLGTLAGSATAREATPHGKQVNELRLKVGYLSQDNRQVCFTTFLVTSTEYDFIETVQTSADKT